MKETEELELLIKYQRKYGKRGSYSWSEWVLRKRTINSAVQIIMSISGYNFSDFEQALYFRCEKKKLRNFLRSYEIQMEEAFLHPEEFIRNLDSFFRKTCLYIEGNRLYKEFFDYCRLIEHQRRLKIKLGQKRLFDAYLSMIMQQVSYFSRNRMEDSVYGIEESGELLFQKNPYPFIDLGSYKLEDFISKTSKDPKITAQQLYNAYKPYGYEIHSMAEIETLEAQARVFDNNSFIMIPYINKHTLDISIKEPYQHKLPNFPRQWKQTELYREKLLHRSYMLPVTGVTARYINAGDIKEIHYIEVFYDGEIVLLYRVITEENGEYSGYYYPMRQIFYSIYENSNRPEWHESIQNFILENYMVLACDYEIDKKKNYAMKQTNDLEKEFHFPHQPLVSYTYKQKNKNRTNTEEYRKIKYVKETYLEELQTKSGYIRKLPDQQHASEEAMQRAKEYGLELPEGKTFVRSHVFRVYRKNTVDS